MILRPLFYEHRLVRRPECFRGDFLALRQASCSLSTAGFELREVSSRKLIVRGIPSREFGFELGEELCRLELTVFIRQFPLAPPIALARDLDMEVGGFGRGEEC